MQVSVVIPCYNTTTVIFELIDETISELEQLGFSSYEFILVNDSSPDKGTFPLLLQAAQKYRCIKLIDLSKNFGQANAQMAALNHAMGDIIINLDDDMQTHPESIALLYQKLQEGYDVVIGEYPDKKHSFLRRCLTKMNDSFDRVFMKRPKELQFTSLWVMKKFVRDEIVKYPFPYAYFEGLILRATSNIANVPVDHVQRAQGSSGYDLKRLVKLWSNFTSFSILPLRLVGIFGFLIALIGVVYTIVAVVQKILIPDIMMGYTSLLCVSLIGFGLVSFFLGVIGEYIGRIFICLNNSPQFVIRRLYDFSNEQRNQQLP